MIPNIPDNEKEKLKKFKFELMKKLKENIKKAHEGRNREENKILKDIRKDHLSERINICSSLTKIL